MAFRLGGGVGLSASPSTLATLMVRSNAALRTRNPKKLSCFVELEKIIFLNSNKAVLVQKKIKWLSKKIFVIGHPCEFRLLFSFTCFMPHGDLEKQPELKKRAIKLKSILRIFVSSNSKTWYFCQTWTRKNYIGELGLAKIGWTQIQIDQVRSPGHKRINMQYNNKSCLRNLNCVVSHRFPHRWAS